MHGIRDTVGFAVIQKVFDDSGKLLDESYNKKVEAFLQSLIKSAEAMKSYPRAKLPE